jgi:hypothetical protein
MAQQPFKADKIVIGKLSNIIEKSPEGEMIFRDTIVEGVALKDLVGGATSMTPAIVIEVEKADWTEITVDGQTRYRIEVPHPWDDLCDPKINVNIWNTDNEEITINNKTFKQTGVLLESTVRIDIKVVMKRL